MRSPRFGSWLASSFLQFVSLKRACGHDYSSQAAILETFDRHLVAHEPRPPLTTGAVLAYALSLAHLSPRARDNVVSVVWPALRHAQRHGLPVQPLPARPRRAPLGHRLREPFVLTHSQVKRLLTASLKLAPTRPFTRATHSTLFGLLYTTGLRLGEARALDVGDLDRRSQTLLVRTSKFKKQRLLPLPSSTADALVRYLEDPLRPIAGLPDAPLFVSRRRRRLGPSTCRSMLRKAAALAAITDSAGRPPRPHDLRHTFAVHRVASWYSEARDLNALLPLLSTYMGHVSPANTYVYLRAASMLGEVAANRFEQALSSRLP